MLERSKLAVQMQLQVNKTLQTKKVTFTGTFSESLLPTKKMNVFQYCKDPQRTLLQLTPSERKTLKLDKYNDLCDVINKANRDYKAKLLNEEVRTGPEYIAGIVDGLISPEGLALIMADLAVDYAGKAFVQALYRGLTRGVSAQLYKAAVAKAASQASIHMSRAIVVSAVNSAVQSATVATVANAAARAISVVSSVVGTAFAVVQVVGGVLDMIDYMGYSRQMDGSTMNLMNDRFNEQFADTFLSSLRLRQDKFGVPIAYKGYPIEYRYNLDLMKSFPQEDINLKMFLYSLEYLNNLKYNSIGQQILTSDEIKSLPGQEVFDKDLKHAGKVFVYTALNRNTVVLNWARTYWWVIILALAGLLWFLLR